MRKQIVMVVTALMVPNMSFAEDLYPKEVCKQIYESIGVFLAVADKAWKSQDEEKAIIYSKVAANYATVYGVTCKP